MSVPSQNGDEFPSSTTESMEMSSEGSGSLEEDGGDTSSMIPDVYSFSSGFHSIAHMLRLFSITPTSEVYPRLNTENTQTNQPNGRLLTPAEGCGSRLQNEDSGNHVLGARVLSGGKWPWVALLGYRAFKDGPSTFRCDGSLISSRHVLTAAHCILNGLWFVRLGEHDVNTSTKVDVKINGVFVHPGFEASTLANDVAVLTLDVDVEFNGMFSFFGVFRNLHFFVF